jgi:hypothetical protein
MIEISDYIPIQDKGFLRAKFTIKIDLNGFGGLFLREMCLFESDGKRWIKFMATKKDEKWIAVHEFERPELNKGLFDKILAALDERNKKKV